MNRLTAGSTSDAVETHYSDKLDVAGVAKLLRVEPLLLAAVLDELAPYEMPAPAGERCFSRAGVLRWIYDAQ